MTVVGEAFVEIKPQTGKFLGEAQKQLGPLVTQLGRGLSAGLGAALGQVAQLGKAALGTATAVGLIGAAGAKIGIGINASIETATLQFQTLLGSADAAKAKVADLFEFAKKTPFETGPIIAASKTLQTFGGDALNSMKRLTLVGDAAAATSAPIEEVSMAIGRAYAAIQAGKPFGEAAQRLTELAILTPKARNEIEGMAKAGKSADEIFAVLEQSLGRFAGAMKLQEGTWEGLKSTIKDTVSLMAGDVFKPLFLSLQSTMKAFVEFSNTDAFDAITSNLRELVEEGTVGIFGLSDGIKSLSASLTAADVDAIFDRIEGSISSVSDALGDLKPVVAGVGLAFASMAAGSIPVIGSMVPVLNPVIGALGGLLFATKEGRAAMQSFASDMLDGAKAFAGPVLDALNEVVPVLSVSLAGALNKVGPAFKEAATVSGPAFADAMREIGPPLASVIDGLGELASGALPEIASAFAALASAASGLLSGGLSALGGILDILADNADRLVPVLVSAGLAFKTIDIADRIGVGMIKLAGAMRILTAEQAAFAAGVGSVAVLGLGAAVAGYTFIAQKQAQVTREQTDSMKGFAEALAEAETPMLGVKEGIEKLFESGKVLTSGSRGLFDNLKGGLLDWGKASTASVQEVERAMLSLDVTSTQMAKAILLGDDAFDKWVAGIKETGKANGVAKGEVKDLVGAVTEARNRTKEATEANRVHAEVTDDQADAADRAAKKIKEQNERLTDLWHTTLDVIGASVDQRRAQIELANAAQDAADATATAVLINLDSARSERERADANREAASANLTLEDSIHRAAEAAVDEAGVKGDATKAAQVYREELGKMANDPALAGAKDVILGLLSATAAFGTDAPLNGAKGAEGFGAGANDAFGVLGPQIRANIAGIATDFDPSAWSAAGGVAAGATVEGAKDGLDKGKSEFPAVVDGMAPAGPFPSWEKSGEVPANTFKIGVTGGLEVAVPQIQAAADATAPKHVDFSAGGEAGATSFVSGFRRMINTLSTQMAAAAQMAGLAALAGLNRGIQAQSPSKATAESADDFVVGFTQVIEKATPVFGEKAFKAGDAATTGLQEGLAFRRHLIGEDLKEFNTAVDAALEDIRGNGKEWFDLMVQDAADSSATMLDVLGGFNRAVQVAVRRAKKDLQDARRAFDIETAVRRQGDSGTFLGSLNLAVDQSIRDREDAIAREQFDALTKSLVAEREGLSFVELAARDLIEELNKDFEDKQLAEAALRLVEQKVGVGVGGTTDVSDWRIFVNGMEQFFTGTELEAKRRAESLGGLASKITEGFNDIATLAAQRDKEWAAAHPTPLTEEESLRQAIEALQAPKELERLRQQLFELQHPESEKPTTEVNVTVNTVPTEVLSAAELAYLVERSTRLAVGIP